jgi:hypothetical protein
VTREISERGWRPSVLAPKWYRCEDPWTSRVPEDADPDWFQLREQRIQQLQEAVATTMAQMKEGSRGPHGQGCQVHDGGRRWTAEEIERLRQRAAEVGASTLCGLARRLAPELGRTPGSVRQAIRMYVVFPGRGRA